MFSTFYCRFLQDDKQTQQTQQRNKIKMLSKMKSQLE